MSMAGLLVPHGSSPREVEIWALRCLEDGILSICDVVRFLDEQRRAGEAPAARRDRHDDPSEKALGDQREKVPEAPEEPAVPSGGGSAVEAVETLTSEDSPAPNTATSPTVPPAPADPSILRSFEDLDAPDWIVALADRIGADAASPEEQEAYRRWCWGEDNEPRLAGGLEEKVP